MQFHEIANVWPMLEDDKLQELVDDIGSNGLINPIWTYEGKILDGRNRYRACLLARVKPVFKEYTGDEPTAFAVSMNDKRRHMNKGQLGAIAAELEPYFAEDAKKRQSQSIKARDERGRATPVVAKMPQLANVQHTKESASEESTTTRFKCPDCDQSYYGKGHICDKRKTKARQEAAKSVGVGERYVQDAKKVKLEAPEIFEKLKAGKITMQDAKREVAKKPTDDWRKDERDRQAQVNNGITVVANAAADKNLICWAERQGLAVRIDRSTKYGNPFVLNEDGDRDEVCDAYERHYLPHKPSILRDAEKLKGKVLICHCYPERCHGNALMKLTRNGTNGR
jgi:hypothetical protein